MTVDNWDMTNALPLKIGLIKRLHLHFKQKTEKTWHKYELNMYLKCIFEINIRVYGE